MKSIKKKILLKKIGIQHYQKTFDKMKNFINKRTSKTTDELWLLEHYSVFTQGKSEKENKIMNQQKIPIIKSNRGGKITYHGPGQQIMYTLLDLKRNNIGIKKLINSLERSVINTLSELGINSHSKSCFPGVYVKEKKICSIGLRIYKYFSSHGLALNINMNLNPFKKIVPCGIKNIKMTQISNFIPGIKIKDVQPILIKNFCKILNFKY